MSRETFKEFVIGIGVSVEIATRHSDPFDCDACGNPIPLGAKALKLLTLDEWHWIGPCCLRIALPDWNENAFRLEPHNPEAGEGHETEPPAVAGLVEGLEQAAENGSDQCGFPMPGGHVCELTTSHPGQHLHVK